MLVGFGLGLATAVVGLIVAGFVMNANAPAALGDSEYPDTLYGMCAEGNMAACDTLYWESACDSDLEAFGGTCGSRTPTPQDGNCVLEGIEVG